MSADVLATIGELARDKLGHDGPITAETRLVEDLELDSLRLLTLAMEVEDHFRICLDEDEEAGIETVGDLVALVERKLEERRLASPVGGVAGNVD